MNIISFIPARGGSKGIPRKNIRPLGDKPLIAYSIEVSLACGLRTIVNTDDSEIANIAREYGAEVMEITPEEARERGIHQDESGMYQVLKSEIPRIDPLPELVLLLQPTSPFRNPEHIRMAIEKLILDIDKYDSIVSVEHVPEKYNPAQVIIQTATGARMASGVPVAERIKRRQDFPEAYTPTGSIYLFKVSNLDKGSIYGERVTLLETEPTININDMSDWEAAEAYLQQPTKI